jgi:hypothetical protein
MKIIGFSIDGVTRDRFSQFDKMYRKKFIRNEQLVKMDEYFRFVPEEEESDGEVARLQSMINEKIKYPVDTYDLKNHYRFENNEEFENFLNQEYVFEIYGSAPPVAKAMDKINKLQKIGESNKSYEVVLMSPEEDQAVQATYHFLAKSACRVKKIIFEKNVSRIWDFCDVIVTDNPELLESKPTGKTSVKITTEYNKYDSADHEFNTVNEIEDSFFVKLFKPEER